MTGRPPDNILINFSASVNF